MRRPPPIGSPHRGILCVEKIGSVAPELQERPGTPSKPVKSTNGPFYWLTRKRAPPCRWILSGDPVGEPCRGTLWGDPVGGPLEKLPPGPDRRLAWYCYRGADSRRSHLAYTPTERDHTGPKKISFGKKLSPDSEISRIFHNLFCNFSAIELLFSTKKI